MIETLSKGVRSALTRASNRSKLAAIPPGKNKRNPPYPFPAERSAIEVRQMKKFAALLIAAVVAGAPLLALADNTCNPNGKGNNPCPVPEIDVGSATKGIALLVAGLLLVGEGLRRRR